MVEYWLTVGIAALLGAALGALATVWGVARNIEHKAVIEERQKWRDTVRDLIPRLVDSSEPSEHITIRDSLVLRLNPYRDQAAVSVIDHFVENPSRQAALDVVGHFQDLLKRDWERAKIEASVLPWWARVRADLRVTRQAQTSISSASRDRQST